jgi:hypothetical protein
MIRPANVLLLAAWLCGAALSLTSCKDDLREKISVSAAALAILGLFAFVFWYPQYIYNVAWYGRASIFPVCPIGSLQITYGLFNLKYETIIAQGAASSLYYPNPWFTGALPAGPIWNWYLLHPVDGAATIVAHVFAAFTIDHLFVYRYEGAGAPLIVPILGWALISTGLLAIDAAIRGNQWWRRGDTPVWVHTGVVALGSILFCMGAAVETRMALFPLAVISVAGVYGLAGVMQRPGDHRAAIAACVLIVLTGSAGAIALRSLETTNLMLPSKDFARLHFPCYHAHPAQ